jgi:tRNA(Ile)-lysidine synthase
LAAADPGPSEAFAAALDRAFPGAAPGALGLAVSGGSDSMALMALAADWASARGTRLEAVTVDHGMRPEAADEARMVANAARALGLPHRVLAWQWDRKGNLQDAARRARFSLLAGWAAREGLAAVLLGHTRNDQAETLLMRLARGSGVDERVADGVRVLRPLLDVERYALRQELNARALSWAEDPTNDDPAFDRVRTRRALAALGLDDARLAETAARMADARAALEEMTRHVAASSLALDRGDLTLPQEVFAGQPAEIRHRLLAHLLRWRAHSPYRPRYRPLRALAEGLARGRGGTLHGCFVSVRRGTIRIAREYAAVASLESRPDTLWDGFWRLEPAHGAPSADTVRALGERALGPLPDTHGSRPPRESLMASPALWRGDRMVAAPLAGLGEGWTCQPVFTVDDCLATLLSH